MSDQVKALKAHIEKLESAAKQWEELCNKKDIIIEVYQQNVKLLRTLMSDFE